MQIYNELVSLGTKTHTPLEPMEVFKLALQKDASFLFLCHNHGSGDVKPSGSDENVTNRLIQVGKIVGIEVVDHIIIAPKSEDYFSFRDNGLIAKLEESTLYVPPFKLVKQIKQVATETGIKKGELKKALSIAREMKKKKLDPGLIKQITGLSASEISAL